MDKQAEVGDLSPGQVEKVYDKAEACNKQAAKSLTDRRARFRAKANGAENGTEQQKVSA